MTPGTGFRILVIGGAGVFGSRLVDAVLASTGWDIVVAGRDAARAHAFVASRHSPRLSACVLDTASGSAADIRATGAQAVVDAAGPFQGAGYALAAAAIDAGCHYVDIADARGFVEGFAAALDTAARGAGVVALTGVSSTPALSNAALDALTSGWSGIDEVTVALSPGNRAPRGKSVFQAILSYVGQPVRLFMDGRWQHRAGWGMSRRMTMPGLGRRWLSLCDTPDLDILPARYRVRRSAVFLAGLELPLLHLGLALAGLAVRWRLLRSLVPFSGFARAAAMLFERFGTDRGGMLVEATGCDAGGRGVHARWSLVATGGDGPSIPILPALAALRAIQSGRLREPGARVCAGVLTLAEIEAEFTPFAIHTERSAQAVGPSLFRRMLGASFDILPAQIKTVHDATGWREYTGVASITGAERLAPRLVARLFGFPQTGTAVPVRVTIACDPSSETWTRDFGGRVLRSRLSDNARGRLLEERFGPFAFRLTLTADATGVGIGVAGWRLGPLPLPLWLAPGSAATETVSADGLFRFDVPVDLPMGLGRVVRYTGTLRPAPA